MKINEMTMRGPNFDKQAEEFGKMNEKRWLEQGKHIADIEQYKVIQHGIYYSLWDNDQLVAFCSLSNADNTVDDVFVQQDYRNKKIFSMMLWFFKTRLNRTPLLLGPVHSNTMQEVVKGLSRFKKYWVNIKTNEKVPFDINTVDEYYSYLQPTPWRLVLENNGEFNWPMFNGNGYIKESYLGYID